VESHSCNWPATKYDLEQKSGYHADLVNLVKSKAAIGLWADGPVGDLAILCCLTDEHVMQGKIVADGILSRSIDNIKLRGCGLCHWQVYKFLLGA
jgi:hypothetical protein